MLRFISLGSGSSGNCYFLHFSGTGLIIDCGIGIRKFKKYFNQFGLPLSPVAGVLVTHDHTDHVKAVGAVAQAYGYAVYTSEKVHQSIMRNHFVSKKIPAEQQHIVRHGVPFELPPFKITSFFVPHDSAENNGYIIEADGKRLVLLTDVGHFTEQMREIVSQATHLIIEANYDEQMLTTGRYPKRLQKRIMSDTGHADNEATARFLASTLTPASPLKHIWLCHLSAENNTPDKARSAVSQALREAGIPLAPAPNGLTLDVLPRQQPTLLLEL